MAQRGLADVEDVARFARTAPQVADRPAAPAFVAERGEIVFEDVTFRYKSAGAAIYDRFSLRIAPRERLALVGPTGSGKSTFVKLIQRLYDLQGGRILIDGQDIAEVTQGSLRRSIAVVPQDPALFHSRRSPRTSPTGVLAPRWRRSPWRPGDARAGPIVALPKGYDTLMGERGVQALRGASGSRVALARAFLADAPILVQDEATSSLDVETEAQVQAASEELMAGARRSPSPIACRPSGRRPDPGVRGRPGDRARAGTENCSRSAALLFGFHAVALSHDRPTDPNRPGGRYWRKRFI